MSVKTALNPLRWIASGYKLFDRIAGSWLDAINPYDPKKLKQRNLEPVEIEESGIRKSAAKIFMIAFGAFLIWAFVAPIDQGVFVPGSVTVQGNRKQVQHPSGGVVTEILVKEGQEVKEGDVLLKVNPLNSEANLTSAQLQFINLLATESRLKSERDARGSIAWDPELNQFGNDRRVAEAKSIQQKLFNSRAMEHQNALAAKKVEVETLTLEANNAAQLAKEGFMPQAQASAILRNKVSAEAAYSALVNGRMGDINKELAETQKNREAFQQRVQSLAFDADLNNIKAPVAGVVTGLKVNTVGGVISGTQVLMEIVPAEETLIIEARVPTNLIDKVRVGMDANLRFVAFNMNTTPVIPAKVTLVGADKIASDKITDIGAQNPQGEYYLARVETTPEGQKMLGENQVQPGMPVDVIVKAGERNFVSYVMKPLTDTFSRALLN
jgi:membrane fusion protein, protease secretion system